MKNLRIAKKNPSKILKIMEVPQTYRYDINRLNTTLHSNVQQLAISTSKQKQSKFSNVVSQRDKIIRSPSKSQRIIEFSSMEKANKIRSKSLNRSDQMIKIQHRDSLKQVMKHSIELKSRNDFSPYIKRNRLKQSQKFLNFHSVNLGTRHQKSQRESKDMSNDSSKKRYTHLKVEGILQSEAQKRAQEQSIESAKRLLNNGQYRKSLLILKSLLKNKPQHAQGLYLSAVNSYHLQDKAKVHYFTELILQNNARYSPQCYKLKAVCYFKTLEYSKSLFYLQQCHDYFPNEPQSYDLQGKIYLKMRKWREAIDCYLKAYQFAKNVDFLGAIGACYQQLQNLDSALQFYSRATTQRYTSTKYFLKKIKLHSKLQQYQSVVDIFDQIEDLQSKFQRCKEKEEIFYQFAYVFYKLKKYSKALILIDQGLRLCDHQLYATKFNKLILMIKINERDIYEAFHLVERLQDEPQLKVLRRFVEGIINMMRRNYNDAITILLSIQGQLGFSLDAASRFSNVSTQQFQNISYCPVADEFLNQISKIYLMFLSFAYFSISEFHSAKKFIELQKQIGVPEYFELGLCYNYEMCIGIIDHCERRFKQAQSHFIKAKAMYDNKLQPPFSLALNYLQMLIPCQIQVERLELIQKVKGEFSICRRIVGKAATNTAASVYYFSSLLNGYLQQWKQALINIDASIDRSQDHYWRYFYIRGMLLACIHSFKQAINDLTIALNISNNSKPECFLMRSKCLQIEGEGNQAFKDLQQYISLKPDDPEVHKYAGQLLFQNGAFQDSLTAFSHQTIPEIMENFDIFLTQGKSYFLMGRFKQAITSMGKSNSIRPSQQIQFDIRIMEMLDTLTNRNDPQEARGMLEKTFGNFELLGRIFKVADFHVLRATCFMIQEKYVEAIESFSVAIKQKSNELIISSEQDQAGFVQNKKDLQSFSNQLKYNIVLCYLNLNELESAVQTVQQINIPLDQPYYSDFVNFKRFVTREVQIFKKEEVFPNRNKLSNFISKIKVKAVNKSGTNPTIVQLKLCIPFPKVQPPQIFPSFDRTLLVRLSVLNVERKPEAPWILRENNSIKFTDKIETFSRLELQDSQNESSSTYQIISIDNSHLQRHSNRSRRLHTSQIKLQTSNRKLQKFIE